MEHYKTVLKTVGCVAVMTATTFSFGLTMRNSAQSVEQMSKDADEIIVGNVVSENTRIVDRSFETDYQVEVHENLKDASSSLPQGKKFTLTLPGGVMTTPPLSQYISGVPYMTGGEEVVLFLKAGSSAPASRSVSKAPAASTFSSSYKIVGWNQGRFTVVDRPGTGEKVVTRINMENYGMWNSSEGMKTILNDIATSRIALLNHQVARGNDLAAATRTKDPLELTMDDNRNVKAEQSAQAAAGIKAMRLRGGVPVQNLEEFKAQVKAYASGSN